MKFFREDGVSLLTNLYRCVTIGSGDPSDSTTLRKEMAGEYEGFTSLAYSRCRSGDTDAAQP